MHIHWNYVIGFVLGMGSTVSEYAAASHSGQPRHRVAALTWGAGWAVYCAGGQFCHGITAIAMEAVGLGAPAFSLVVHHARPSSEGLR